MVHSLRISHNGSSEFAQFGPDASLQCSGERRIVTALFMGQTAIDTMAYESGGQDRVAVRVSDGTLTSSVSFPRSELLALVVALQAELFSPSEDDA